MPQIPNEDLPLAWVWISKDLAKKIVESRGLNIGLAYLRKGSGVLIILIGFYLIWLLS